MTSGGVHGAGQKLQERQQGKGEKKDEEGEKGGGGSSDREEQGLGWLKSHLEESLSRANGGGDAVSQTLRALER